MFQIFDVCESGTDVMLYGYDVDGNVAAIHVTDIPSFIAVEISDQLNDHDCQQKVQAINTKMMEKPSNYCPRTWCSCELPKMQNPKSINNAPCFATLKETSDPVLGWERIYRFSNYGYEPRKRPFLKLRLRHAGWTKTAINALECVFRDANIYSAEPNTIEFLLASKDLSSFSLIDSSHLMPYTKELQTTCRKEYSIAFNNLHVVSDPKYVMKTRELCIDIETIVKDKYTKNDMIGMIACRGRQRILLMIGRAFTDPLPDGWITQFFDTEKDMLLALEKVILDEDPDLITGYNIEKFDMPRIIKRFETLGITPRFSRHLEEVVKSIESISTSQQSGTLVPRSSLTLRNPGDQFNPLSWPCHLRCICRD
jgi:hypothetical protein